MPTLQEAAQLRFFSGPLHKQQRASWLFRVPIPSFAPREKWQNGQPLQPAMSVGAVLTRPASQQDRGGYIKPAYAGRAGKKNAASRRCGIFDSGWLACHAFERRQARLSALCLRRAGACRPSCVWSQPAPEGRFQPPPEQGAGAAQALVRLQRRWLPELRQFLSHPS